MDEELMELQRQFEFAQQAKSSIRLSDRNVVELIQKLHQLQIIDFDLLHTVSGKEFITPEQLRNEITGHINRLGRVSLIDLADYTGVDLYHVEKQAQTVVSNDSSLTLTNGEIISSSYWDSVAEEINERLQECSQISLAEIATQLQVGSELLVTILEPRLGSLVKGRLEGGQLYTPAYVARVNAMVRGAARGITVPMNLSAFWSSLQLSLQEMDGANGLAVDGSFFQSLFNGLLKEGDILGSLRGGVHWTPTVFAIAQKMSLDTLFSQNSFIGYEVLHKLGVAQPIQYLQSRYPEGIPLVSIFVHPSMIEMLDSAAEDAINHGSWIDSLSVLPESFSAQDAHKLLTLCPTVQLALKSNRAVILGESYVFSAGFVKDLFDHLEKETGNAGFSAFSSTALNDDTHAIKDAKVEHDSNNTIAQVSETFAETGTSKQALEKGSSKKKKGKPPANCKNSLAESGLDNQESVSTKSKKNQRKTKVASDSRSSKKDVDKVKEDSYDFLSEDWLAKKIILLNPDFQEQGMDDPDTILIPLINHLRPMLIKSWNERRKVAFTENAQRIKRMFDDLQRKLDESYLNLQLYERALDLFEDDQSTSAILHRHLLRTTAANIANTLLINLDKQNKLKNGVEVEDSENPESMSLSSGERIALAKCFPAALSIKAAAVIEALEAKRVEIFNNALRAMADESGLTLKKLDKKLERTLLHSYRKDLISQISAEDDPVPLLPKVVSLLYIQVYGKALQAPGRAISIAIFRLKDKLDDSAYKILMDYHGATVTLLALISAATGNDEDCSSDRILTKQEFLKSLIPSLKALVVNPTPS